MEVNVIKSGKNMLEIELDNLTIAEFLRNELWDDNATELAVWKRKHPSENPILVLKTKGKGAKKVLLDTIERLHKKNTQILSEFKKVIK
ncbi:MAG: hypothetical protein JSW08_02735 [archaeon]|nr:MAG: hypothetical protein JSW08_02735 [archaeon]